MNSSFSLFTQLPRRIFSSAAVIAGLLLALFSNAAFAHHPVQHGQSHWRANGPGAVHYRQSHQRHGYRAPAYVTGFPPPLVVYNAPYVTHRNFHRPGRVLRHRNHHGRHFQGCGFSGYYPAPAGVRANVGVWVDGVWIAFGAQYR